MMNAWPWQWSMAGLLAVLVFGMHASLRFWFPGILMRLFGEVPDLAQAPPAMIMLLVGYVLLSLIGGVLMPPALAMDSMPDGRRAGRLSRRPSDSWQLWSGRSGKSRCQPPNGNGCKSPGPVRGDQGRGPAAPRVARGGAPPLTKRHRLRACDASVECDDNEGPKT
jgi:hypothetical protein